MAWKPSARSSSPRLRTSCPVDGYCSSTASGRTPRYATYSGTPALKTRARGPIWQVFPVSPEQSGKMPPMDIKQRIKDQVTGSPVVLYMKGTPQAPQCGFSALAVQVLTACGVH